jgi:hypothetical protein
MLDQFGAFPEIFPLSASRRGFTSSTLRAVDPLQTPRPEQRSVAALCREQSALLAELWERSQPPRPSLLGGRIDR